MTDIQQMGGTFSQPETIGDMTRISGSAPLRQCVAPQMDVTGYTHGKGRLSCILSGYEPCHNTGRSDCEIGYDSETDIENHRFSFLFIWRRLCKVG